MNIATEDEIIKALETDLFDEPNILEALVEYEIMILISFLNY